MTTRKDFLVAGTIAAALAGGATAGATAAPANPKLDFDLDAFNALLETSQSHKNLFAACVINGGEVFGAIRNTLNAYRDTGIDWNDVFPVAVLYHGVSIALAFDDAAWNDYFIPFARHSPKSYAPRVQIESVRTTGGNPCLREQGGRNDTSIRSLIADAGTRFFVCNNAAHGFANAIAVKLKKSPDTVYADLARHLVPNAMLVPAGVWAVHAIQEQRFTLLHTSLPSNA
ncbi:MAG TPA: hypothetical protein VMD47_11050 [Candidatus Acidoferrales bacterium]|nr:hypothetical protein [Candidatus Acidoferrales bacterium]